MRFLVCLDGSPRSLDVLPHAVRLANAVGSEVVLTRVLDDRVDAARVITPDLESAVKQVEAAWQTDLDQRLAATGVPGRAVIVRREWSKELADAITALASAEDAAVIALSSRGSGALRHAILGSVAMGVISRSPVPVMATGTRVEAPAAGRGGYHLVITSDGSPDARSVFAGLRPLLDAGHVRVTLLEIAVPRQGESEAAARWRATEDLSALTSRLPAGVEAAVEVRVVPPGAGIDTAILAAVGDLGADAVAMATHGHSARRHLVAGSTALGVLGLAEIPVILVKSRAVD
ncbi:MAG: universal stress protein [Dehalococcoidia bacterium]|jgi:nucleotide-binding universal stress UspA family protein